MCTTQPLSQPPREEQTAPASSNSQCVLLIYWLHRTEMSHSGARPEKEHEVGRGKASQSALWRQSALVAKRCEIVAPLTDAKTMTVVGVGKRQQQS